MQTFVQTKFNVRIRLSERVPDWTAWCDQRAQLFLDVTLPSMLGQTDEGFEWLIYFDPVRTDPVERVLSELRAHPHIHALFYDGRGKTPWHLMGRARMGVAARVTEATRFVITIKLDSDDGLHREYISSIGALASQLTDEEIGNGIALNFTNGALLFDGQFFAFAYPHSPYLALVEPVGEPLTAMTIQHHKVHTRMPVRQLSHPEPMWLQVIHGSNAFNRPRIGMRSLAEPERVAGMFSLGHVPRVQPPSGRGGS
jgi:hypothetical protein